jgi:DNA-binding NarL/FixJ family response regulator
MASTPPLRVMLVDDYEVVRDGIKALLASQDDIIVCAEAASVRQPSPRPTAPSRT